MDEERERDATPEKGADMRAAERLGVNDAVDGEEADVHPSADQTGDGGPAGAPPARTPGQGN